MAQGKWRSRASVTGIAAATMMAGAIAAGSHATAQGPGAAPPNIVVVQADDQSLEMMRVMRKTNRLIGDRGATFRNNFTNWPVCCPSRATQLTGQYAHNHGVLGNKPPDGGYGRFPREDNLAVWLERVGYEVGHTGKFLNGYGPSRDFPETPYDDRKEVPPGWTDWLSGSDGTTYRFWEFTQNEWSEEDGTVREGDLVPYGTKIRDFKSDVNTRDAVGLIRKYAGGSAPFYLQVDYLPPHSGGPKRPSEMPHPPYNCGGGAKPAPRHAHAFDRAPLAARRDPSFNEARNGDKPPHIRSLKRLKSKDIREITGKYRCRLESTLAIDEGVADIIHRLRRTGELGNTYVFYTADNGFFHGEHRIPNGKNHVYEPSIRVPLLMRGPRVPRGVNVRDLTTNADFATTVMALTGASSEGRRPPDGRSLIPAARNPRTESGRELLIETDRYTAIRTQRYKWVEYDDNFVELYDLQRDRYEERNVANSPQYAGVRARLAARLADLRECIGAGCSQTPALEVSYERKPAGGSCVKSVRVGLEGADVGDVAALTVRARGSHAGSDGSDPFSVLVGRRELKGRGPAAVEASAALLDGRRVTWRRSFKVCR